DIARGGCAEDRIGDGVADDIGIGVATQAALEGNRHTAEHERTAIDDSMQVVAHTRTSGSRRQSTTACAGFRYDERLANRNLDVRPLPFDNSHDVAGALRQLCFVVRVAR